ncbi:BZ3500_MvSof-1268-A1-R1_Chr6-3g08867 [Microbotryum saponariae]|uniref:DASH complex subunit DAD3 n=1 Tax=Microbotryum saponariae TaxID=289078 RepID=A0A2X0MHI2_9BASI|nr:BZ3500_MvSof-1268-A1-R1_Chr6-3g08867 [Microbotryum saponariae]SDA07468.1 BZ3501_MvSof-1269-A2-R1_Chr6-2g08570 [Microbotryum saponariae]
MASASIANAAAVHALVARLEDQVLKEYSNVSHNLDEMSTVLQRLSSMQPYMLNQLRPLERKLGLVLTLFKGTCPTSLVHRSRAVWALLVKRDEEDGGEVDDGR